MDTDFKELISLWILFLATDSYLSLKNFVAYMLGICKKLSRTCQHKIFKNKIKLYQHDNVRMYNY